MKKTLIRPFFFFLNNELAYAVNVVKERTLSESGMNGESSMETNIRTNICKIESQWEFAVWLRELKQGICNNLEMWNGERDVREVEAGEDICIPTADLCWYLV